VVFLVFQLIRYEKEKDKWCVFPSTSLYTMLLVVTRGDKCPRVPLDFYRSRIKIVCILLSMPFELHCFVDTLF
jgi:hypothetical protein